MYICICIHKLKSFITRNLPSRSRNSRRNSSPSDQILTSLKQSEDVKLSSYLPSILTLIFV